MAVLFGSDGIINMLTLIFGAIFALGGLVFRKTVANDMLDIKFSFIGCMVGSMITFIVFDLFFDSTKIIFVSSLIGWLIGGYFGGLFLWDGEAEGGSE